MGAAWAYEALSFGGYWAWDPVENMSLVPWIILIAGIHSHLVARSTVVCRRAGHAPQRSGRSRWGVDRHGVGARRGEHGVGTHVR